MEWRKERIKDLIKEREARGWDFYYLSADISAFHDGRSIGFDPKKISHFKKEDIGEAYHHLDDAIIIRKGRFMNDRGALLPKSRCSSKAPRLEPRCPRTDTSAIIPVFGDRYKLVWLPVPVSGQVGGGL